MQITGFITETKLGKKREKGSTQQS